MNSELKNNIDVATGDVKVASTPAIFQCLALGSCVAVIMYDEKQKIAGIAHVMLPSSDTDNSKSTDALKYANNAIDNLVLQLLEHGAKKEDLSAVLVGGASVIENMPDIGKNNIESINAILQNLGIGITAKYIGGNTGRSLLFDVSTGELKINGKLVPAYSTQTIDTNTKKNTQEVLVDTGIEELKEKITEPMKQLSARVEELDNIRKATFNLLEDLEKERENLSEATARDDAMLRSIGDGVLVVGMDAKILLMNKSAENLLGYASSELMNKSIFGALQMEDEKGQTIPVENRPMTAGLTYHTQEERDVHTSPEYKVAHGSYYYVRKDGTRFPAAVTTAPVILRGKTIGVIEVFRDITEEKRIDRAKTEFVSLASHQLRTPLTTISWYSEMMLNGDAGEVNAKQKKYLEEIYQGDKRMIELVNTLLDVSRIELGTFIGESVVTDIIQLAENVLDEQKHRIEEKKIILTKNFGNDIPKLFLDPKLLRMVFQNLLTNSIKYTEEGGKIDFTISDKNAIHITFSDTGVGIPKHQQDKIFTKLFRADNARDIDPDGTGLGLYIVKSIVTNFGGEIHFNSEENKGTTFYITLPLDELKDKDNVKKSA